MSAGQVDARRHRSVVNHQEVDDTAVTTADLLEAWREATRAAELAKRLAKLAAETSERADVRAGIAEQLAVMARNAAEAAEQAAKTARTVADEAAEYARSAHAEHGRGEETVTRTQQAESDARDSYHRGVDEVANSLRDAEQ
jgi:hypothetical protein